MAWRPCNQLHISFFLSICGNLAIRRLLEVILASLLISDIVIGGTIASPADDLNSTRRVISFQQPAIDKQGQSGAASACTSRLTSGWCLAKDN